VQDNCVSSVVLSLISRLRFVLHRHGVRGTVSKVVQRARESVYSDLTWVWYELPLGALGADRPQAPLPPGLVLTRGGASEASLLNELRSGNEWLARRWLEAGNDLWLVLDDGRPVFACMIFHGSTPTRAARGGWLPLPPDTVCLEASSTSASYRGRGLIGPAAWSQIADKLEKIGAKSIITHVAEDNKVMRWALVRSGFREIATVHLRRVGFRQRVTVVGTGTAADDWIAVHLQR
jgi:hypothetical protein